MMSRRHVAAEMRLSAVPLGRVIAVTGGAYLAAILVLIVSKAPLGSRIFFVVAAVCTAAYAVMLARVWREPQPSRRLLFLSLALAVIFRIPPALAPVDATSDM